VFSTDIIKGQDEPWSGSVEGSASVASGILKSAIEIRWSLLETSVATRAQRSAIRR
jgi:hypothetical protein